MAVSWDTNLLPFKSVMFARDTLSRSGGRTITGIEQVVQSVSELWTAKASFRVRTVDQRRYYRSLQAMNWGRSGQWLIPPCDPYVVRGDYGEFSLDFSSDFSIGASNNITAQVNGSAVLGARQITFTLTSIADPVPPVGCYFSIGSRLYLIASLTPWTTLGKYTATFVPGLRVAVASGATVEFTHLRCLMRLASDTEGQMDLDMLRFSDVTLNFIEVPPAVGSTV